jgi:hypothetical protein
LSPTRQRFEGSSIETALAAAVDSLGPDLEVAEARKVRSRGMLGFFAKERFEVLAAPKGAGVSDAVCAEAAVQIDQTLAALVARVEADEKSPASFASTLAAANPDWHAELADFIGLEPVEAPAPDVVVVPTAAVAAVPVSAPSVPPAAVVGEPCWGREALRRLGLPAAVLDLLNVADGDGDAAWTMNLVAALQAGLAQELSGGSPAEGSITVSGHGASAAFGLIRAAADGARPATLHLAGGNVPATAMELALAVRSCLPR